MKIAKTLVKLLLASSILSLTAFAAEPSRELMASCESSGTGGEPVMLEVYVDSELYCSCSKTFPGYLTFYGPQDLIKVQVNYGPDQYSVIHKDYQLYFDEFHVPGKVTATLFTADGSGGFDQELMTCELPEIEVECN